MVWAPEPDAYSIFHGMANVPVVRRFDSHGLRESRNLFIETSASRLPEVSAVVRDANESKYLKALMVRADIDLTLLPQILHRADLRMLKNVLIHGSKDWDIPRRVLNAWSMGSEHELIANAAVFDDRLYVLDCALKKYEISFNDIIPLSKLKPSERTHFTIDEMGSFIHWPADDIDLDIDNFKYVTDSKWRAKVDLESLLYSRAYGSAVESIRLEHGLTQKDIPGLSDRQLRRIEKGEAHPGVETLKLIAKAHKMTLHDYFEVLGNRLPRQSPPRNSS